MKAVYAQTGGVKLDYFVVTMDSRILIVLLVLRLIRLNIFKNPMAMFKN